MLEFISRISAVRDQLHAYHQEPLPQSYSSTATNPILEIKRDLFNKRIFLTDSLYYPLFDSIDILQNDFNALEAKDGEYDFGKSQNNWLDNINKLEESFEKHFGVKKYPSFSHTIELLPFPETLPLTYSKTDLKIKKYYGLHEPANCTKICTKDVPLGYGHASVALRPAS